MHYTLRILRYVVKPLVPANKSRRSLVDLPQLLHPNPRETNEDGIAIVKAAEYKSMNKGALDSSHSSIKRHGSIKSKRASNDPQLPQMIVAATAHLLYMMTEVEL